MTDKAVLGSLKTPGGDSSSPISGQTETDATGRRERGPLAASSSPGRIFPAGCTCLSYGHGLTMTRVNSPSCEAHNNEEAS